MSLITCQHKDKTLGPSITLRKFFTPSREYVGICLFVPPPYSIVAPGIHRVYSPISPHLLRSYPPPP